jgi:beta-lactamase class A
MPIKSTLYFPHLNGKKVQIKHKKDTDPRVKGVVFFFFLGIIVVAIILLRNHTPASAPQVASNMTEQQSEVSEEPTSAPKPMDLGQLSENVTAITKEHEGNYSVRFEHFKKNASFGLNDEVVVDAASVNKIPILAAVYYLANKGELNLDEEITIAEKDVQNYGTGTIYTRKPPHIYSIRELVRLMMHVSDNTAAYVLSNRVVGRAQVQKIAEEFGMKNTDISENTTTNRDQATLMRAIFESKVAGSDLTTEMKGFMEDTIFEDRLPSLIPEEVHVYHKIGNQVRVIHDVGVIEFSNEQYYLGVLTTDIPDEDEAKNTIGEISKVVYEFVNANL